jgi:predicted nucleic-acid-binding protein
MIGLDTNILARYFVADDADTEAEKQRQIARELIESGKPLLLAKTVLLELNWVLIGRYGFGLKEVASVFDFLLTAAHIEIEDRAAVESAVANIKLGFTFADALHHASYAQFSACEALATFDDRSFARKAKRVGLSPTVSLLK